MTLCTAHPQCIHEYTRISTINTIRLCSHKPNTSIPKHTDRRDMLNLWIYKKTASRTTRTAAEIERTARSIALSGWKVGGSELNAHKTKRNDGYLYVASFSVYLLFAVVRLMDHHARVTWPHAMKQWHISSNLNKYIARVKSRENDAKNCIRHINHQSLNPICHVHFGFGAAAFALWSLSTCVIVIYIIYYPCQYNS